MVTQTQNGTRKATQLLTLDTSHISPILKSPSIALSDSNWRDAMHDEYNALIKNDTWVLVPKPHGANIVRSLWLFRHKYNADGSLSRYKARLVANGSSQQLGIDCDETFSPVVKPVTIRIVFSLALTRHWHVHQLGVKNAFLNAYATRVGFSTSRCDSSLFIYRSGSDTAYLLIYVDDIVLTASTTLLQQIISSLHSEFDMTDMGALNYFLGIFVTRDSIGMFLSQKQYAIELLDRAHMLNCNPTRTPADMESNMGPEGTPVSEPTLYRSLAGGLQYLTFTRPDLSYDVQQICLYMHDPREPHLTALKHILRYIQGTLDFGLQLYASSGSYLIAYSDTDWTGCPATRRSTSGYCVFLGNNLLSWSSKRNFYCKKNITPEKAIQDGDTLISSDEMYELGFFSPGSFVSLTTENPVAQLLSTENLVVRESDQKNYVWQSFDYPGDTFLPGMKYGKEFVSGLDGRWTAWKSIEDPSPSEFVSFMDTNGFPQLFETKQGSLPYSRFGPWNFDQDGELPRPKQPAFFAEGSFPKFTRFPST
ncbi:ribonuclease H-like domain-containing protein, partial [Tanacetum coccineum]